MKKIFFSFMLFAVMLTPVVLTSCGDDNNENVPADDNKLSGSIQHTRTLDASVEYLLTGPLIVEEGGVLNIPAGTTIKAQKGFGSYILVLQGGKINVNGTASAPVTMTANIENAQQGHWGGLIINGKAPLSGGEIGKTEINNAYVYGGTNVADNWDLSPISYLPIPEPVQVPMWSITDLHLMAWGTVRRLKTFMFRMVPMTVSNSSAVL